MTAPCRSDAAAQIRARLTAAQVAEFYGFEVDRGCFTRCPFHSGDNHGSLKLYPGDRGWHCFGCSEGGDVIDFVMRLFKEPFRAAVARMDSDFRLGLTYDTPDPQMRSEALEMRRREAERKERILARLAVLGAEHRACHEIVKFFQPELCEDGSVWVHPLYADAVHRLPVLDENIRELEAQLEHKK